MLTDEGGGQDRQFWLWPKGRVQFRQNWCPRPGKTHIHDVCPAGVAKKTLLAGECRVCGRRVNNTSAATHAFNTNILARGKKGFATNTPREVCSDQARPPRRETHTDSAKRALDKIETWLRGKRRFRDNCAESVRVGAGALCPFVRLQPARAHYS